MLDLTQVKKIVVHAGNVHLDDLLCLCVALAYALRDPTEEEHERDDPNLVLSGMSWLPPIYRMDPTPEDLADPRVLVMDVGGVYDPSKLNFDHHQLDRDAPPTCALTLLVRYLEDESAFRLQDWFSAVELIDSKGPFAYTKSARLPRFPGELVSPIETAFKAMIEQFSGPDNPILPKISEMLMNMGTEILERVNNFDKLFQETLGASRPITIGGVLGLLLESSDTGAMARVREHYHAEWGTSQGKIAFSISHDDRGMGWALYRFEDDPRIDFSKIENDPRILFSHTGGFIAKTHHRIGFNELRNLVEKSIV